MEEQRIWIKIILWFAVLFLSAFFSAAVTALSSLRRIHVGGENNKKDSKEEKLLRLWLKNPNELLITLLFGKTVIYIFLIGMSILLFKDCYKILGLSVGSVTYDIVMFVIISVFVLIFVEMIPIIYAKSNVYKISKTIIVPLDTARIILRPFILIFIQISKFLLGLFKVKLEERIFEMTEEDIKTFVKAGTEEGIIEEEEEEMIHSIFEFSDTTVKEILTPRTSVFALDSEKTLGEVWNEIVEQGFSRIPVYNENIDKIEGIVHIKDLLKYNREENSSLKMKEVMKEAYYVPATKTLTELLEEFKRKQSHMAIIIDEYGGTLGIVTIEDLLEEIVGEIWDEFDQEEESIQQIRETIYDIKGDTLIEEINDELKITIPVSEEYDTVAGYVQDVLGKVAETGNQVKADGYILKVMEVDNKRIEKIRIIITEKSSEESGNDRED